MPAILERCVLKVMAKGHSKDSAWAICRSSLGLNEDGSEDAVEKEMADEELDSKIEAGLMNPEMTQEIKPMVAAYGDAPPEPEGIPQKKLFNENHDEKGQFSSGPGGGAANPLGHRFDDSTESAIYHQGMAQAHRDKANSMNAETHMESIAAHRHAAAVHDRAAELHQRAADAFDAGDELLGEHKADRAERASDRADNQTRIAGRPRPKSLTDAAGMGQDTGKDSLPTGERTKSDKPNPNDCGPGHATIEAQAGEGPGQLPQSGPQVEPTGGSSSGAVGDSGAPTSGQTEAMADPTLHQKDQPYADARPTMAAADPQGPGAYGSGGTIQTAEMPPSPGGDQKEKDPHQDKAPDTPIHESDEVRPHSPTQENVPEDRDPSLPQETDGDSDEAVDQTSRPPYLGAEKSTAELLMETCRRLGKQWFEIPAIAAFNPNHDDRGQFSSGSGGGSLDNPAARGAEAARADNQHEREQRAFHSDQANKLIKERQQMILDRDEHRRQEIFLRHTAKTGGVTSIYREQRLSMANDRARQAENLQKKIDSHDREINGHIKSLRILEVGDPLKALFNQNHDSRGQFASGPEEAIDITDESDPVNRKADLDAQIVNKIKMEQYSRDAARNADGARRQQLLQEAHDHRKDRMKLEKALDDLKKGARIAAFNENHDDQGRFSSGPGGAPAAFGEHAPKPDMRSPGQPKVGESSGRHLHSPVVGRNFAQISYETGDPGLKRDAARLRMAGFKVYPSSLGSQVTKLGSLKITQLNVAPDKETDMGKVHEIIKGPGTMHGLKDDGGDPSKAGTVFFSAPSISPQTRQSVLVGETLKFPIEDRNFTGDSVTIKVDPFPLPKNASWDGENKVFTFVPEADQVGSYDFVFTASDGIQQLSQSVIVTVEKPPITKNAEVKAGTADAVPEKALFNPNHDESGRFSSGASGGGRGTFGEKASYHRARVQEYMAKARDHMHRHRMLNHLADQALDKNQRDTIRLQSQHHATAAETASSMAAYHQEHATTYEKMHAKTRRSAVAELAARYRACGLSAERAADLAMPPDSDPAELQFNPIVVPEFMVGQPNSFQVSGRDLDGDPVEINAEDGTIPPWAEYDKDTGVFKGTPTEAGSWTCTFILTDGVLESRKSVTVPVVSRAKAASQEL